MQTRAFAASRSALVEAAKQLAAQVQSALSLAELESLARAMEPLMREASMAVRAQVLDALAPALRVSDLERMVLVAGLCGALLDDGLTHTAAEEAIVERYLALAQGARRCHEAWQSHGDARPDEADALAHRLLARTYGPAVSVLVRVAQGARPGPCVRVHPRPARARATRCARPRGARRGAG